METKPPLKKFLVIFYNFILCLRVCIFLQNELLTNQNVIHVPAFNHEVKFVSSGLD